MGILSELAGIATGGLGKDILNTFEKYFPPNMSPEQRAALALEVQNFELRKESQFRDAQNEAERIVNERIAIYEGSSKDIAGIPFLGAIMLFLRGSQRIAWGFGTLVLDYNVFSNQWSIHDPIISNAFWVVNFLVLGFLFGERAVMNVMPFFTRMVEAKQGIPSSESSLRKPV